MFYPRCSNLALQLPHSSTAPTNPPVSLYLCFLRESAVAASGLGRPCLAFIEWTNVALFDCTSINNWLCAVSFRGSYAMVTIPVDVIWVSPRFLLLYVSKIFPIEDLCNLLRYTNRGLVATIAANVDVRISRLS